MSISVTTYNIQTDVRMGPQGQQQDFNQRCPNLLTRLQNSQLGEIINLQEVPLEGVQRLQQLQNYHVIHRQHFDPNNLNVKKNDAIVILLRKDRFDFTPGSEIEVRENGNPNISLIVRAIEKQSQKATVVFNTHVRGGPNRTLGDNQVATLVNRLNQVAKPNDWIVGGGDFNGEINEKRIQLLQQAGFALDPSPQGTITEPAKNRKIDHLFTKNLPMQMAGNRGVADNFVGSDHFPLSAQVLLPQSTVKPVNATPFQNKQPTGSFREIVMRHFQKIAAQDDATNPNLNLLQTVDQILTQEASAKGFETAVTNRFQNYLQPMLTQNGVDSLMRKLKEAFDAAKIEKSGQNAAPVPVKGPAPVQAPLPATKPSATVQTPAPAKKMTVIDILLTPFKWVGNVIQAIFRSIGALF